MKIAGIGTDIVDIERFQTKINRRKFVQSVFSPLEIGYCLDQKNSGQCFAARFAAKEAYMKAIGKGWSKHANFNEIEIFKNAFQAPVIRLSGETLSYFEEANYSEIFVSLSHTRKSAVAFVIVTF